MEGTKQAKSATPQMCTSKHQRVQERRKNTAGTENRNWHCPSRTVRWQELPVHNTSAQFSSPCLFPGIGSSENKKSFPPHLWWVFNHAEHSWQQCTTFYSHSVSSTLPFRDSVAPSLPNTMPSAHKPCHSKGPFGLQADRTEETSKRSLCCCTITMEDPQTQTGGKARGTAINITSFKRAHRERLITLADLNIWIIAVAFL